MEVDPARAVTARESPGEPHTRRKLGRPRLLIIGCGDVGLRIVSRLAARFRIVALTSRPARAPLLRAAGVVPVVGDLDQRGSLRRLRGLATRVLHLAPPGQSQLVDMRTRGLAAVLAGAVQRAVYVSTTGVYGDHGGRRIDETARLRPTSERAQRRVDAERTVRRRWRGTVLRVPGIYAHDRLPLERLREQLPALADADDVYSNHIHAEDLARICITALQRGAAARVYNAVDDDPLKIAEYFDVVADATGLPRPPRMPRAQLKAVVSPMMYSFMSESRRLENRRLKRELRFRLHYPTVAVALQSPAENKHGPGGSSQRSR